MTIYCTSIVNKSLYNNLISEDQTYVITCNALHFSSAAHSNILVSSATLSRDLPKRLRWLPCTRQKEGNKGIAAFSSVFDSVCSAPGYSICYITVSVCLLVTLYFHGMYDCVLCEECLP